MAVLFLKRDLRADIVDGEVDRFGSGEDGLQCVVGRWERDDYGDGDEFIVQDLTEGRERMRGAYDSVDLWIEGRVIGESAAEELTDEVCNFLFSFPFISCHQPTPGVLSSVCIEDHV